MMSPIILSIKCALFSVVLNVPWGLTWGWLLARKRFPGKILLQTVLYLPLVVPPVLTGYGLLLAFGVRSPLGRMLDHYLGIRFVLDWKGASLAAAVVASPFLIQAVKVALEGVDRRLEWIAGHLGATPFKVWWTVTLPLAWQGIVSGLLLVFVRSLGEFGATIIVAGNIPGQTQTIPLAIYSDIYLGQEQGLIPLVLATMALAYVGLLGSTVLLARKAVEKGSHGPAD